MTSLLPETDEVRATPAESTPATEMNVSNNTDRTCKFEWMDFNGNPTLYHTLEPEGSYTQSTYVGHVWRFVDAENGTVYGYYIAESGGCSVNYTGQSAGTPPPAPASNPGLSAPPGVPQGPRDYAAAEALLGCPYFITKSGQKDLGEILDSCQVFGVYFSAHWCPPCRNFTPILAEFYQTANQAGKKFEVFFASRDRSGDQFEEYYGEMPWAAFPFGCKPVTSMMERFGINGIPRLMIFNKNGDVISENAYSDVVGEGPPVVDRWIGQGSSGMSSAPMASA